jgi:hypothetical protein
VRNRIRCILGWLFPPPFAYLPSDEAASSGDESMPIVFVRDDTRRTVHTTVTGAIRVADIVGHFDAACRNQILGYIELIDARGATKPYVTAADIWQAATLVRNASVQHEFGRRAVIVDSDVTYGLTRMFATLIADHFPIEAFRDQNAAEDWLGSRFPVADSD